MDVPVSDDWIFVPLQEIGIKILTNSDVKKPYDCMERQYDFADEGNFPIWTQDLPSVEVDLVE